MPKMGYKDELAEQLQTGRVALMCGAGISIPAGLPSAMSLASKMCELICSLEASRTALIDEVCVKHHLPFEAFIEIVIRVSGDASFLGMFAEGWPAAAHQIAAQLIKQGFIKTIVTTNFDLLFERAIMAVGIPAEDLRIVSTDIDFAQLSDVVLNGSQISLLKVHGSYGAGKDGMLTTLRQLGQKRLLDHRMKTIEYLFRTGPHDLVLILGYSCSDVFDISPRIETLLSPLKRVVFLHHSSGPEELLDLNAATALPFKNVGKDSWLIRADTNGFLQEMRARLKLAPIEPSLPSDLWSKHVDDWFGNIGPSVSDRIVAAIFRRCGRYELAQRHYEMAIPALETDTAEIETLADVFVQIGALHQLWGNYPSALKAYNDALERLSNAPTRVRSTALYQIGRVNEEIGDYRSALRKYEESMGIDQALGDQQGVATCLHQTGIIYQEYLHEMAEAESRYQKSLHIRLPN